MTKRYERSNEGLIYEVALDFWKFVLASDIDRSLTLEDLVQNGRVNFFEAIPKFDPLRGTKLTTYVRKALINEMINTIKPGLDEKKAIGGEFLWLDAYEGEEDHLTFIEKYADPYQRQPEPIVLEKEFRLEVFHALDSCAPREKTYLAYRYGYPRDEERTKKDTREHFGLSETRAEKLEHQACEHLKENYLLIQHGMAFGPYRSVVAGTGTASTTASKKMS